MLQPGITCASLETLIRGWLPSGKIASFVLIYGRDAGMKDIAYSKSDYSM